MNKKLNNKGFTLVELLAVLAILIAIMAIAIPSISSSLERTKAKQNAAREKVILSAAELYIADHKNAIYENLSTAGVESCYILIKDINYLTDEEMKDADDKDMSGNYVIFTKPNTYQYSTTTNFLNPCDINTNVPDEEVNNNNNNDSSDNNTVENVCQEITVKFYGTLGDYAGYYFGTDFSLKNDGYYYLENTIEDYQFDSKNINSSNFFETYKYVCYSTDKIPVNTDQCSEVIEIKSCATQTCEGNTYIAVSQTADCSQN